MTRLVLLPTDTLSRLANITKLPTFLQGANQKGWA